MLMNGVLVETEEKFVIPTCMENEHVSRFVFASAYRSSVLQLEPTNIYVGAFSSGCQSEATV